MAATGRRLFLLLPPNQTNNGIVPQLLRLQNETKADKEMVGLFRSGHFPTINPEINM